MGSLLWRKLARDLRIARGRMLMMIIAIAVGIFGVTSVLSAYTVLNREVSRNYLGTNPASAQLEMDKVDGALVAHVCLRPGIADAEASSAVIARIEKKPGEWMKLLLFVTEDFSTMRINAVRPESGAWPPPTGSVLVEREAMSLINAKAGDVYKVRTPNGPKHDITISGTVHDPGLAPAWQEATVYGYITPSTLKWLGESSDLHILKVTVKDRPMNAAAIEHTAGDLAGWLKQQGYAVHDIRIPPPGKHPHQNQMNAAIALLLLFSFLALGLGGILTATLINGLLSQQVRQIGIMKSVGARSRQIAFPYLAVIVLTCIAAAVPGVPLGIAAGRGFVRIAAQLLNLNICSMAVPGWVYIVLILSGVLIPLQIAHRPIIRAARITVREAVNDYGVSRNTFGSSRLDMLLGKIRGLDRTLILALRNAFRRKGRLLLTLCLLAAAGAMFMASLNVKTAWESYTREAASTRHYDLEIVLNRPESEKKIADDIENVPGVRTVESWNIAPVAINRPDGLNIVRTYPDEGHGSFTMRSVPAGSRMLQAPLISGRWLEPGDTDAVVLNHMAYAFYPQVKAGGTVTLDVNGHPALFKVVGIVKEILTPATAYVSPGTFEKTAGLAGQSNAVRIAVKENDPGAISGTVKEIERMLERDGVSVKSAMSEAAFKTGQSAHVRIYIDLLILMAVLMAVVGTLGLMSAMGTNVTERTREFGVMRTIGGKSATVMRNVIFEGVFIGLMSWVAGIVLSLPLSAAIDSLIGKQAFLTPLPMVLSFEGILLWAAVIICGSAAASVYPAWKAAQLTIRETLSFI